MTRLAAGLCARINVLQSWSHARVSPGKTMARMAIDKFMLFCEHFPFSQVPALRRFPNTVRIFLCSTQGERKKKLSGARLSLGKTKNIIEYKSMLSKNIPSLKHSRHCCSCFRINSIFHWKIEANQKTTALFCAPIKIFSENFVFFRIQNTNIT